MKNKIIVGLLLIVSLVVGITTVSALTYQSRAGQPKATAS